MHANFFKILPHPLENIRNLNEQTFLSNLCYIYLFFPWVITFEKPHKNPFKHLEIPLPFGASTTWE